MNLELKYQFENNEILKQQNQNLNEKTKTKKSNWINRRSIKIKIENE